MTSPQTQHLRTLVKTVLIPRLHAEGFRSTRIILGDKSNRVVPRELHLERPGADGIEQITFAFEKYGAPKFQIWLGTAKDEDDPERRHGSLVRKPGQYYYLWGKPWWLPMSLWSEKSADKTVKSILEKFDQMFRFLERGDRGPNISPETVRQQV